MPLTACTCLRDGHSRHCRAHEMRMGYDAQLVGRPPADRPVVVVAPPARPTLHNFDHDDMRVVEQLLEAVGLHVERGESYLRPDPSALPPPDASTEELTRPIPAMWRFKFSVSAWFAIEGRQLPSHALVLVAGYLERAAAELRARSVDFFAGVPYANLDAIECFKTPPIGRCLCFACWAPNEHGSWADARAAGWYAGTWSGPEGWAIVCPDCYAADADPVPR